MKLLLLIILLSISTLISCDNMSTKTNPPSDSIVKPPSPEISKDYLSYKKDTNRYIAHAGGMIEGKRYTNSLEALNQQYDKGFRLFELDICKTSDGKYVAMHDWKHWKKATGYKDSMPVTHKEFLKHKLFEKLTPLDLERINNWFTQHKDAILVTDKINEPKQFSKVFIDKNRLMMELFSKNAIKEGIDAKIKSAILSQEVLDSMQGNKVEELKKMGITEVAFSRRNIAESIELLKELKKNNIRVYVYHINQDTGKDEEYVTKYEMDLIYGMYADNWDFRK